MKKTLLLTTVIVLAFGLLIVWANQASIVSKDNSTHSKTFISKTDINKDAVQNKQSIKQAEQTFEKAKQAAKLEELREKERLAEEEANRPEIRLRYEPSAILATGDDCTDPIVIALTASGLPYTTADYTCGRGNNYDATCLGNYDGGEDIMYEIINTDAADIVVDIVMTTATTYTGMAIDMVCPPGDPCLDYCTSGASGGCSLYGITLMSGVSYYLMIDTWPAPDCIPQFDLLISNATPPWDCFDYPPPGKYAGGYEYEPNDTCTFANQAVCEHAYCGDIMPDADEDWWIITLPVDGWYSLHIRVFGNYTPGQYAYGGGLDPKVSVYDIDCTTLLLFNDDYHGTFPDAESYDSQIDTSEVGNCFPPGSNLFINVEGYGSTSTGPYLLVINCYPCEEPSDDWDCDQNPPDGKLPGGWETEPNDNCPLEADEALCEYAYCGDLSTDPVADTVDWWYVDIPDDGFWHCLHVRVFGDDTPYQYAYSFGLDPNVGLYYPDCNTLDVGNDDYGGTFPDAVNWDSQVNCYENCYPPGSTVYIKINSMWQDYGPYLLIINCDTCSVPEDPECPPNSMFEQLPIPPDESWWFGLSDINYPLIRYDNYIVDNEICDIHWWGLELATTLDPCVRYPNMFDINFYTDMAGQPGALVCSYPNVTPTRVGTGIYYSIYGELMYYSLDLNPCCPQLDGWVSIVGVGDPDCLFYWAGSNDGDTLHYSSPDGIDFTAEAPDLAFCLTGPPPEPLPNFHNIDGYLPADGDPIGTAWHELYPIFCQNWTLTSWVDNGDGILSYCDYVDFINIDTQQWAKYHVEWVGPTLTVTYYEDIIYLDFLGDNPLIDPIPDPIGTGWYEKYPDYGDIWVITVWEDNGSGFLDFCDWIEIYNEDTGEYLWVHVEAFETDISLRQIIQPPPPPGNYDGKNYDNLDGYLPTDPAPVGTAWHEVWPNWCVDWQLTSWMDCNGSGYMDSCDITDWTLPEDPFYVSWEHVIWVGPTIVVEDTATAGDLIYFEVLRNTDYNTTNEVGNPIDNWFWEVNPNYCTDHYCVGWHDSDGSGFVDYCDYILLESFSAPYDYRWYHVLDVRTDMITEPLFFEGYNFHNVGGYLPIYGDPIETIWHELYPTFCQDWMCVRWVDNADGILSVCDTVDFLNLATEDVETYHIKWIGPTITVEIEPGMNMYLDMLSTDYATMEYIYEPWMTLWFEKYPDYKVDWWLTDWSDNGNGYLDSCDYITLGMVHAPYDEITVHVIDISTDISMTLIPSEPDCYDYLPGDANMAFGLWPPAVLGADVTYLVNYFKGSPTSQPCFMNTGPLFWASADANGDCMIMGSDVVRLVNFFGGSGVIEYCPDYEPCWPPIPGTAPTGWPNCVIPLSSKWFDCNSISIRQID